MKTLNVPVMTQESPYWCWATTGVAVLKYLGTTVSQCDFVKAGKVRADCPKIADTDGILIDVGTGLAHWTVQSNWQPNALTLDKVVIEIDADRPIVAGRIPVSGHGTGHAVVVDGYDKDKIHVMDPWTGTASWVLYKDFCNDGTTMWGDSLDSIHS